MGKFETKGLFGKGSRCRGKTGSRIGGVEVQSILSRRLECDDAADDDDDDFRLCLFTLCSSNLQACPTNQPSIGHEQIDAVDDGS